VNATGKKPISLVNRPAGRAEGGGGGRNSRKEGKGGGFDGRNEDGRAAGGEKGGKKRRGLGPANRRKSHRGLTAARLCTWKGVRNAERETKRPGGRSINGVKAWEKKEESLR